MTGLSPCAFCGSDDIATLNAPNASASGKLWAHQCEACGVQSAWRLGREVAVAAWNRRTDSQPDSAKVAARSDVTGATPSPVSPAPQGEVEERLALKIAIEDGCGLNINGRRALCDDPEASAEARRDDCFCKKVAAFALTEAVEECARVVERHSGPSKLTASTWVLEQLMIVQAIRALGEQK